MTPTERATPQPTPTLSLSSTPLLCPASLFLPNRLRCHFSIFGDGGVCILPDSLLVYLSTDFAGCCGSGAAVLSPRRTSISLFPFLPRPSPKPP